MSKFELGRSGSSFELCDNILTKISPDASYNHRLKNQYNRQNCFVDNDFFAAPKTFGFDESLESHRFSMEYIKGMNFDAFCTNANTNRINEFADSLLDLIDKNLEGSIPTKIDFEVFKKKIWDMKQLDCFTGTELDNYFLFLYKNKITELPIGVNHGDLTMANIIFSDKFYLIDFLDNLFDTPLNDLVKIQQDSKHKFYLMMTQNTNTKVSIFLDELDNKIKQRFSEVLNSKEYIYLCILSLLRIIPYVNSTEKKFVIRELEKYEHITTNSREIF